MMEFKKGLDWKNYNKLRFLNGIQKNFHFCAIKETRPKHTWIGGYLEVYV